MKRTPFLLGGLIAAGCANSDDTWFRLPDPLPPVAVGSRVAYVDRATATAFVVDPGPLQVHQQPVGENPVFALPRPGRDELLVLSRGVPDQPDGPAAPASLAVVATEAGKPARRHALSSRFSALSVSPDGRFAVLHFDPAAANTSPADSTLVVNPNEIAVLDLDAPASSEEAPSRGLRSFGGVPRAVLFSPPLMLTTGAGPRALRLAVVLSDNYLTLFDLENDRTEITVSLTRADEPRTIRPEQVLFDPGEAGQDPTIFVRSSGSNDIVALRLTPAAPPPGSPRTNDFRPVLSLLGSGARPSDLALYRALEGPRLLMLSPDSSEASVIDPRTSRVTTFRLETKAERILLYEGTSPAEPERRPRALLLAAGGGQIGFLDLDRLEELRGRGLELRPMSSPVVQLLPLVERGMVIATHGASRMGGGLSVIDLDDRTISPLVGESLGDLRPGPAPTEEIWLLGSKHRLGRLNLARLTATEVRLDMSARSVMPLAAAPGGGRFVVVDHESASGSITVIDAEKPERRTARSLVGFLYSGFLDRSKP
jgi:hypothetical protein